MSEKDPGKRVILVLFFLVLASPSLYPKGHFELGIHYSAWGVNIIKGLVEDGIGNVMEDTFIEEIQTEHENAEVRSYSQSVSFDSGGGNLGLEIRWYPGGETGSFSLGLAVEKTTMKLGPLDITASMDVYDPDDSKDYQFEADAAVEFLYKPLSFLLNFRWDIKPSWRVRPFLTFGLGFAGIEGLRKAQVTYSYEGTLTEPGETEIYSESETKTISEIEEEIEEEDKITEAIPFIPFVQFMLGVKGEITKNLYVLVDAGIFNGFVIRGGLALRF